MIETVEESWQQIADWLATNLPEGAVAIQPPASRAAVSRLEALATSSLPDDLVQWWYLADGMRPRSNFGCLLPLLFTPLRCEAIEKQRALLLSWEVDGPGMTEEAEAGSASENWLSAFLPIADSASEPVLFVDLRPGDLHGCVVQFDSESGGSEPYSWSSVTDMLADLARSLTTGTPVLADRASRVKDQQSWSGVTPFVASVHNGRLVWQPSTQSATTPQESRSLPVKDR